MYTGMSITSAEKGTSISIGYVGESYIDYGPVWMFGPIFGLGLLYGVIFRIFAMRKRYAALGNAMGVAILIFNAYTIETSNIKLVGNSVTACLVFGALYLSFGRAISAWLKA